jgi:hypothetical protein
MQGPHTLIYIFLLFLFLFFLIVHLLHEVGGEDAAGTPTGRPPWRSPPPRCSLTSWCFGVPGSLQSMSSASSRRAPPLRRLLLRHRRNTIGELRRCPSPCSLCPIAVNDPLVREVHGGCRRAGSFGGSKSPQQAPGSVAGKLMTDGSTWVAFPFLHQGRRASPVHPKLAPLLRFIKSIPAASAPSPAAAIHQILPVRPARGATAWGRVEAMGWRRRAGRSAVPCLAGGSRPFSPEEEEHNARLRAAAAVDSGWWSEEEERPCPVSLFLL